MKYFWIKERHNPQFDKPYYSKLGQITSKRANDIENKMLYGYNVMLKFSTEKEYLEKIEELKEQGFTVNQ